MHLFRIFEFSILTVVDCSRGTQTDSRPVISNSPVSRYSLRWAVFPTYGIYKGFEYGGVTDDRFSCFSAILAQWTDGQTDRHMDGRNCYNSIAIGTVVLCWRAVKVCQPNILAFIWRSVIHWVTDLPCCSNVCGHRAAVLPPTRCR